MPSRIYSKQSANGILWGAHGGAYEGAGDGKGKRRRDPRAKAIRIKGERGKRYGVQDSGRYSGVHQEDAV